MKSLLTLKNLLSKIGNDKASKEIDKIIEDSNLQSEEINQEIKTEVKPELSPEEEAVLEFGGEPISEDEYIKQEFEYNVNKIKDGGLQSIYQEILNKEKIHVLYSKDTPELLGKGLFGKVFRAVYEGKPVAAKIVVKVSDVGYNVSDVLKKEVSNWEKILEIKLPPELKKHIPIVYKAKADQIKSNTALFADKATRLIDYAIIITEELYPLNNYMMDILVYHGDNFVKEVNRQLKDEEYLYEIARHVDFYLKKDLSVLDLKDYSNANMFLKIMLDVKNLNIYSSEEVAIKISNYFIKQNSAFKENKKYITDLIQSLVENCINPTRQDFPYKRKQVIKENNTRPRDYSNFWENSAETKGIIAALNKIAEECGLHWNDVHDGNIMMGADGNLKIIDVGLYEDKFNIF